MIKTFRGLLPDGGQDKIRLSTIRGEIGYRIVKFQLLPNNLNASGEAAVKIFTVKQDAAVFDFDFSDSQLLAAAYYTVNSSADSYSEDHHVIFDHVVVNQDIYITHKNNDSVAINYYLELEQMKLDQLEAAVATLKDMRAN